MSVSLGGGRDETGLSARSNALEAGFHAVAAGPWRSARGADGADNQEPGSCAVPEARMMPGTPDTTAQAISGEKPDPYDLALAWAVRAIPGPPK
jgi:hypothetical protein